MLKLNKLIIAMGLVIPSAGAMACASCGCSLNTDIGTQGMGMNEGWTLDIRYDTLNQNKLRYGRNGISQSQAAATTNSKTGGPAEVENYTQNNYLTASLDYNDGVSWGVTASLPYIMRNHNTFGNYGEDTNGAMPPTPGTGAYSSKTAGIGDIKMIGRYFGLAEQKDWGFQYGIKLPTGSRNQTGSLSNGSGQVAVDPALQAGSGSTDLIAGIYKFGFFNDSDNWAYFAQAQYQAAVMVQSIPGSLVSAGYSAGGTYRPGNAANLNLGVNYQAFEKWVPTLQLNVINKTADSGTAADTWATGGTLAYLTPGLLYRLTDKTQVYANVQLPVYQNVNGIQLVPSYIASMGVRVSF
ncbi:hypothetical protein SAMN06295945_0568 [Polynucleobacter meluiroseus]|uniref:MetA-pathway of phenol degradation n=1 Tax=Polynucleobacter meluiroseus TaxID=1938814 RepID=A0A240DZZ3_9BURK|nr:hypothetical protein [Polynucleobacter meluiroseus]SNX28244.1 hypothetical protein SAMN06295945_0568 [Polynucleobacter meluiroseus]